MTLNSDLNVGCAIPIEDDCCKRFAVPAMSGLFNRIGPTGGGGARNPDAADGGSDVTVASGPLLNEFPDELKEFAVMAGRANVAACVECAAMFPLDVPVPAAPLAVR